MASQTDRFQAALLVGDAALPRPHVMQAMRRLAHQVLWADDAGAAFKRALAAGAEVVVVTEDIPVEQSLVLVEKLRDSRPDLPVVVVSDTPSVDLAVRVVRAGAYDFVAGPLDGRRARALVQGLQTERARASANRCRFFCDECPPGVEIAGHSPGIVRALETIRLVAESRCNPVLVLGETGTGKELAARAVHAWRSGNPEKFLAVNCAALTANLLESELFGHVKGAFTGADREKTGLFEAAGSGTIFLDEISEMPDPLQAKLLRVLQEKTFRKVGGVKDIHCNATIIASSNRDLFEEANTGTFRKDLYFRLAVFPITLPPLRDEQRRADIELLAEYFLDSSDIADRSDLCRLSPEAMAILTGHDWPGNVRELKNVLERALILEPSDLISAASIRLDRGAATSGPSTSAGRGDEGERDPSDFSLQTAEREFILRALKETGWQRTRAAALLGITRATLHAKLKRYDIQPPDAPPPQTAPAKKGKGALEKTKR